MIVSAVRVCSVKFAGNTLGDMGAGVAHCAGAACVDTAVTAVCSSDGMHGKPCALVLMVALCSRWRC